MDLIGINEQRYIIFGPFDKGGCSTIDWGWDKHEQKWAIFKHLKTTNIHKVDEEIRINQEFSQTPQCVSCYDRFQDSVFKHNILVFHFIDHIPLRQILPYLQWNDIIHFSISVLNILKQVHEKGFIHRDIKPSNLLLERQTLTIYLIDFGMSIEQQKKVSPKTGTPQFYSPEQERCIQQQNTFIPNFSVDIWAFGCILLEWWTGKGPFFSPNTIEKQNQWKQIWNEDILQDKRSTTILLQEKWFQEVKNPNIRQNNKHWIDFISHILEPYSEYRWSAIQLLNHPFLKKKQKSYFLYDCVSAH